MRGGKPAQQEHQLLTKTGDVAGMRFFDGIACGLHANRIGVDHSKRCIALMLSTHSLVGWCGACVAPGAYLMKMGLLGSVWCIRVIQSMASSAIAVMRFQPGLPSVGQQWIYETAGAVIAQ